MSDQDVANVGDWVVYIDQENALNSVVLYKGVPVGALRKAGIELVSDSPFPVLKLEIMVRGAALEVHSLNAADLERLRAVPPTITPEPEGAKPPGE